MSTATENYDELAAQIVSKSKTISGSDGSKKKPAKAKPKHEAVAVETPATTEATAKTDATKPTEALADKAPKAVTKSVVKSHEAVVPDSSEPLFRDLPLSEEVQLAIQMTGYLAPTPVQAQIIPHVLAKRDVLAQSQTGTGKTAAFALPILSNLDLEQTQPQVLVLAPTRELATQVAKSFETYAACISKFRILAIYGGADYEPQLRALRRGVHVVVGTPGRVIDHIRRGTLKLDGIKCLVLDEADEMLNMGFIEDVEYVLAQSSADKQVALFSATMPDPIRRIADKYLSDPISISIQKKTLTADSIEQRCVFVEERDKLPLLSRMLEVEETDGVIVFTKTKDSTVRVAEHLQRLGLSAAALNGDLPQARRQRTVDQLKSGQLDILVATDVAARGLDVQRISHVFNYDLPHDSESYVHRIGRTGRAGRAGAAIIFLTHRQRSKLRLIERATNQPISVVDAPRAREVNLKRVERFKTALASTMATEDLTAFKNVVSEYAEESGQSMDLIAAALAFQAQGNRAMFVKDMPKREPAPFDRERPERRSSRGEGDSGRPDRGPRRRVGPPQSGMQRYRVEVGKADGVRPGNIVGAVANEAGIRGADIGPIDIRSDFSTIDLPGNLPEKALETLKRAWVAGKQLQLQPFRQGSDEGGNSDAKPRRPKFAGSKSTAERYSGGGKKGGAKAKRQHSSNFGEAAGGFNKGKKPRKPKQFGKRKPS